MEGSFLPECYFDTVLVKTILGTKVVNHKKGCNNVVKEMKTGKLKDGFAVGIVDKDKTELDYLKEFEEYGFCNLNLLKHKSKPHFVIQLNPPLEKWIIKVAEEGNVELKEFGLPTEINALKLVTKSELVDETIELKNLCRALIKSKSETVKRFCEWIKYLHLKRYDADINVLKNV